MKNVETYINQIITSAISWGPKLLLAILTLVIGWRVVRWFTTVVGMALERNSVDVSLRYFLRSLLDVALKILLIISAASIVGIATTSFITVLGAAGLAIGLALQGSLSNFAGGVLILLMKPYRAGDYITAQGHSGMVREIQLFYTILKTTDGRTVIIPNGKLSNETVVNFSVEPRRRIELTYTCGLDISGKEVKRLFTALIDDETQIMKEPPPSFGLVEHPANGVTLTLVFWVMADGAEEISTEFRTKVQEAIETAGHTIACTHIDAQTQRHSEVPPKHLGLPSDRDTSTQKETIATAEYSSSSSQDKT